jgi:histidinol dehydrogenase
VEESVEKNARRIVERVRSAGDSEVLALTRKFDGAKLTKLEVTREEWDEAADRVDPADRAALGKAAMRVRDFHRKRIPSSWEMREEGGAFMGQRVRPLARVGIYVPGGKAAYPSTVIMAVVPAVVAGVEDVVIVTPPGGASDAVLAAAQLAGVSRVFRVGGVAAIGGLAFGTATLPRVDKIVGPGNRFVTEAKRQVAGVVGIDMLAGPTEVLVVADDTIDVRYVAADMIAQAEHDEDATAWCVTTSDRIADTLDGELERQLAAAPRRAIAERALRAHGVLVRVPSRDAAAQVANLRAPEHLELLVEDAWELVERIRHAGAVFVGRFAAEPVGDYIAGPSHVLPTGGTARYVSPLGVYDFVKRISVIGYSREQLLADAPHIIALAEAEGLFGHAAAVRVRTEPGAGSTTPG